MIKLSIDAFEAMARELGKTTETKLIQVTETRTGTCVKKHCFTAVFSNGLTMTVLSQEATVNDTLFSPEPRRFGTPKDSISVEEFLGEQAIPEQLSDKLLNTYKDLAEQESEYDKKIEQLAEAYKEVSEKEAKGLLAVLSDEVKQRFPVLNDTSAVWISEKPVSVYDVNELSSQSHSGIRGPWMLPTYDQMKAFAELRDELHLGDHTDFFYSKEGCVKVGRFSKYQKGTDYNDVNYLVLCLKEPIADSCQVTELNECRPDEEGYLEVSDRSLQLNINGIKQVMGLPSFYGYHICATADGLADALKDAAPFLEKGWEYATDDDLKDLWKYRSDLGLENALTNEMFWRRGVLEGDLLPVSDSCCFLNGRFKGLFHAACCASILFVKRH